jgi:hypothetical protein
MASFFFSRGGGDVSHAGKFVSTIAEQLANKSEIFKDLIRGVISKDQGIMRRVLKDQWKELIKGPLSKLETKSVISTLIVIDALDECDASDITQVLQLIAETSGFDRVRARILVTSRPETLIRNGFSKFLANGHKGLVLHDISEFIVDNDISLFLRDGLSKVRIKGREIDEREMRELVKKAAGLFIWAATASRYITRGKRQAATRLKTILGSSYTSASEPDQQLNEIYSTILKLSIPNDYTNEEKEELYNEIRHILGSIVALFSPLSTGSLSRLLHVEADDIHQILEDYHAILDIPEERDSLLRVHHPSFRDFLLDENRCEDQRFQVDETQAHLKLANHCIALMCTALKQDICGQDAPGVLLTDVKSDLEKFLPPEVQYACLYWVKHLQKSGSRIFDDDNAHKFLKVHVLHWLESLGWMQKISEGIQTLISLEEIAMVYPV